MIIKADNFKKYFLMFILGGSLGNVFDRVYFSAVPDFIDFHINNFHWFIFNVADIFITLGVICLIYVEIFFDKGTVSQRVNLPFVRYHIGLRWWKGINLDSLSIL